MKKREAIAVFSIIILFTAVPIISTNAFWDFSNIDVVKIIRDDYGVPHIYAKTKEGLAYGAGYAMAQDRLWQADLYRRSSFGSLAEFGFASIEQDYNTRSLGYSKEELLEIRIGSLMTDRQTGSDDEVRQQGRDRSHA